MSDDTKSSAPSSESSSSSSSPSSTSESSSSGGKSSRESVGGKSAVHYGYFSNIKTPEYKSGWDDIWGKKKKSGGRKAAGRKKAAPKAKEPESVEIDFAVLPESVRTALAAAAAEQLKKKRVSYAARDKKGDIVWRIACEAKR
jgi:hypothetical protein